MRRPGRHTNKEIGETLKNSHAGKLLANELYNARIDEADKIATKARQDKIIEQDQWELNRRKEAYEKYAHLDEQTGQGYETPTPGDVENAKARLRVLESAREESLKTLAAQIRSSSFDYDNYEANRAVTYKATQGEIDASRLASTVKAKEQLVKERETEQKLLPAERVEQEKAALLQQYEATTDFFEKVKIGNETQHHAES